MTTTATTHAPTPRLRTLPARPADGDRLVLTVTEAGQLLGISRAFAYELAARGELPVIRLGRRLLVPRLPLLAMVGATTGGGATPTSSP